MTTDNRVRSLAKWYYDRLTMNKRDNGEEYYHFISKSLVEAERCRQLGFAAHGSMLPDDWRYSFINEALGAIVDARHFDEIELEADIYNADLTSWLASHLERSGYCDEAVSDGFCDGSDMMQTVACGQYLEKRQVLEAVLQYLRDEAEEEREAEELEELANE